MYVVYCHSSPSGKRYVGYSKHGMSERWRRHIESARGGSPYLLHRAIRKYGPRAFRHVVLEECVSEAEAKLSERRYIADFRTQAPHGYNSTAGGDGVVACAAVRMKLSAAWTDERRAAHGAQLGVRNLGNAYGRANAGRSPSIPARAKMADAARGKARHTAPHSADTRALMSAAQRNRFSDPEQRRACGNGTRGKPWSPARRSAQESRG